MGAGCSKLDCDKPASQVEGNPDISGIGVMVSFAVTAWLMVVTTILYYVISFNPLLDPFPPKSDQTERGRFNRRKQEHVNPVDKMILKSIRSMAPWKRLRDVLPTSAGSTSQRNARSPWDKFLSNWVLALCDGQALVGIVVAITAHALMCQISSYHWLLIVYQISLSNVTYLAGLTIVRHHPYRNSAWKQAVRYLIMFTLSSLLLISVLPTTYFDWRSTDDDSIAQPGSIAACSWLRLYEGGGRAFRETKNTRAFQSMVFTAIFVCIGLIMHTLRHFHRLNSLCKAGQARFGSLLLRLGASRPLLRTDDQFVPAFRLGWISLLVVVQLYSDLLTSMAFEVYWVTTSAIWATIRLSQNKTIESENDWGFGQVFPVLLLLSPLLGMGLSMPSLGMHQRSDSQSSNDDDAESIYSIEHPLVSHQDRDYMSGKKPLPGHPLCFVWFQIVSSTAAFLVGIAGGVAVLQQVALTAILAFFLHPAICYFFTWFSYLFRVSRINPAGIRIMMGAFAIATLVSVLVVFINQPDNSSQFLIESITAISACIGGLVLLILCSVCFLGRSRLHTATSPLPVHARSQELAGGPSSSTLSTADIGQG